MSIRPITNTDSLHKPSFKGVVDKSVKKVISQALKSYCEEKVDIANSLGCKVNKDLLKKTIDMTTASMQKLENFMSKCHPKTTMFYIGKSNKSFVIKNSKISQEYINFDKSVFRGEPTGYMRINLDAPTIFTDSVFVENYLNAFSKFVDDFTNLVMPKDVDEVLLDGLQRDFLKSLNKSNLMGNIQSKILEFKLKKTSAECGSDKYGNVDKIIQDYTERANATRLVIKARVEQAEENKRIIEELLKP